MRMPSFSELDSDQRGIYAESPSDGAILITGPPGTGKTVVAFHRSLRLSSDGSRVHLIMYNRVLSRYTGSVDVKHTIQILNMDRWANSWHKSAFGRSPPRLQTGAIHWASILEKISAITDPLKAAKLRWGHLIVDEGQDFPIAMYQSLMAVVEHPLIRSEDRPTLTVFADENQTIGPANSTLHDIQLSLGATVRGKRYWRLEKNYRNTREIAEFATFYQISGKSAAKLPDSVGGIEPQAIFLEGHDDVANHITNYLSNNSAVEIGVLSFGKKGDVKNIHSKIRDNLETKNLTCKLQMYLSNRDRSQPFASEMGLKFNSPPSITVLHAKSCKGLEFDAVFLVNLHRDGRSYDDKGQELIKDMYVLASRARKVLFCDIVCFDSSLPGPTRLLPSPDSKLCRYSAVTSWRDQLRDKLQLVDWAETEEMADKIRARHYAELLLKKGEEGRVILSKAANSVGSSPAILSTINDRWVTQKVSDIANLITEIGPHLIDLKLSDLNLEIH